MARRIIVVIDILPSINDGYRLVATYEDGTQGKVGRTWYSTLDLARESAEEIDDKQPRNVEINEPLVDV